MICKIKSVWCSTRAILHHCSSASRFFLRYYYTNLFEPGWKPYRLLSPSLLPAFRHDRSPRLWSSSSTPTWRPLTIESSWVMWAFEFATHNKFGQTTEHSFSNFIICPKMTILRSLEKRRHELSFLNKKQNPNFSVVWISFRRISVPCFSKTTDFVLMYNGSYLSHMCQFSSLHGNHWGKYGAYWRGQEHDKKSATH